ncbi:hypothetical protein B0H63DRAFT_529254 [Podospora didyma]|uniref:C2H2-type domain-containing protein n=1 Tax=Podospora didyma TaxID=330526 RepID=A0AAE0K0Q5_9PEZI|nr:hypothetical protein B0H63DRAFT_529254 [Podospora didyma]
MGQIPRAQKVDRRVPQRKIASLEEWSQDDARMLLAHRAIDKKWSQTQREPFPAKTANACLKRHDGHMERRTQNFDDHKVDKRCMGQDSISMDLAIGSWCQRYPTRSLDFGDFVKGKRPETGNYVGAMGEHDELQGIGNWDQSTSVLDTEELWFPTSPETELSSDGHLVLFTPDNRGKKCCSNDGNVFKKELSSTLQELQQLSDSSQAQTLHHGINCLCLLDEAQSGASASQEEEVSISVHPPSNIWVGDYISRVASPETTSPNEFCKRKEDEFPSFHASHDQSLSLDVVKVTSDRLSKPKTLHKRRRSSSFDDREEEEADPEYNDSGANKQLDDANTQCFACPFFRRDATAYKECLNLRLKRIRDVKQHLQRRHYQPPNSCPLCFEVLPSRKSFDEHVRSRECTPRSPMTTTALDGVSREAQERLSVRVSRALSAKDQWYTVWDILFGKDSRPENPHLGSMVEETMTMIRKFWRSKGPEIIPAVRSRRAGNPEGAEEYLLELFDEVVVQMERNLRGETPVTPAPESLPSSSRQSSAATTRSTQTFPTPDSSFSTMSLANRHTSPPLVHSGYATPMLNFMVPSRNLKDLDSYNPQFWTSQPEFNFMLSYPDEASSRRIEGEIADWETVVPWGNDFGFIGDDARWFPNEVSNEQSACTQYVPS